MKSKLLSNLAPYKKLVFKKYVAKGPLQRKKKTKKVPEDQKNFIFYKKSPILTRFFSGKLIKIHNGKKKVLRRVTSRMVGLKVGEFLLTRAFFEHKKKKKKKKHS